MKLRLSALALGATMLVGCASSGSKRDAPILSKDLTAQCIASTITCWIRMWFARWRLHGVIMFPSLRVTG